MATYMDRVLEHEESVRAVREVLKSWDDDEATRRVRAVARPPGRQIGVEWERIPDLAAAVADTLEATAGDAETGEAQWCLDTATMIRVRAGGVARRGRLEWTELGDATWFASGRTGTDWEVSGAAITVAQWDRPDWYCADSVQAKRVAEEIDARPPFPKHLKLDAMPIFAENDGTPPELGLEERSPSAAPDWDPETTLASEACRSCGSPARPVWWKPRQGSTDWWIDPQGYWRCRECHQGRPDPNLPDPSLPVWPQVPGGTTHIPESLRHKYRVSYERQPMPRRAEDL